MRITMAIVIGFAFFLLSVILTSGEAVEDVTKSSRDELPAEVTTPTYSEDVDDFLTSIIPVYKFLKRHGVLYVLLVVGVIILLIVIGFISGVYFTCQHFKRKGRKKDSVTSMEEGTSSEEEEESSTEYFSAQ